MSKEKHIYELACKMMSVMPTNVKEFFDLEAGQPVIIALTRAYEAGATSKSSRKRFGSHPIIHGIKRMIFILAWMTFFPVLGVGTISKMFQLCGSSGVTFIYVVGGIIFFILSFIGMLGWCGDWIEGKSKKES